MDRKEAIQLFAGLLDARERCEHGDFFYENLEDLCDAAILAHADISTKREKLQEE